MKTLMGFVLAAAILVALAPFAHSLGTPASPSGIPAQDWISMGDAAGFVLTHGDSTERSVGTPAGTVRGYFLIRRGKSWYRVDASPDYDVQKTLLTR